jgi:D-psicose/D-tagatose/L-ribulose 3-epimerase
MTTLPPVSVLLSSLPLDFAAAVRQVAALGFTHVDVVALAERPAAHRAALADAGVRVVCAALGRDMPDGYALEALDLEVRRATLELLKRQIADAAQLGATLGYVIPGKEARVESLARFADACQLLAGYAGQRRMRFCVEHIPGRALATAAATLAWLEQVDHPNLALLLDVGHCLISQEAPAHVIRQAGRRLGYVHFDDNDGVGDLHWPLLTGRLTEQCLRDTLTALRTVGYDGALTLELSAGNADPVAALRQGKQLLERLATEG